MKQKLQNLHLLPYEPRASGWLELVLFLSSGQQSQTGKVYMLTVWSEQCTQ